MIFMIDTAFDWVGSSPYSIQVAAVQCCHRDVALPLKSVSYRDRWCV